MTTIALFGSTGRIGQRILHEALARGHKVTAIVRDATRASGGTPNLEFKPGDILKPESVVAATNGHDVLVSAYGPRAGDAKQIVTAAKSLVEAAGSMQPMRLIVVGSAGNLEVAPGVQLVDTPDFPAAWKASALAHRDAFEVYRSAGVDWTFVSPAAMIEPGARTGHYRVGSEQLVVNLEGKSRVSIEDFAVAIVDEIEQPRFRCKGFTVGY
jgi:putative NADH-flavin reductase